MKNEKRLSRFNLGLIISLALTLVAFEWKSYSNFIFDDPIPYKYVHEFEDDWIPEFTKIPEPPAPLPKPDNNDFKLVDNIEEPVEEPKVLEPEPKKMDIPEIPWIEPEVETIEPPAFGAEVLPSFYGGEKALYEYLYDHIEYSEICRDAGVEGTVHVNFIVEKDGSISNVKVVRGIDQCKILNREVVNAIKNMPDWSPAKQGIRTVRFSQTLPVKFTLRP